MLMGIKSQFVPWLKGKAGLQTLKGNPLLAHKHVAVDLSTILHLCLHREGVSHEFHMSPSIPLKSFALEFRKCMKLLVSVPMRILLVCDGSRHPHKKSTDDGRAASVSVKKERLDLLLKRSDLSKEEKTELNKLKKSCVWVREDVLEAAIAICIEEGWPYVCAPFEADFQVSRQTRRHDVSARCCPFAGTHRSCTHSGYGP